MGYPAKVGVGTLGSFDEVLAPYDFDLVSLPSNVN